MMQRTRLKKFIRQPQLTTKRQITDRSCDIIELIARYKFLPTSLLVRLAGGNQR
jgi:hypothetical protein